MLAGAEDEEIQGGVELESGPQKAGTGVRRVEVKKGQSSGQPEIEVGLGGEEPSGVEELRKQVEEKSEQPRREEKKYLLEKGMKGRVEDGRRKEQSNSERVSEENNVAVNSTGFKLCKSIMLCSYFLSKFSIHCNASRC